MTAPTPVVAQLLATISTEPNLTATGYARRTALPRWVVREALKELTALGIVECIAAPDPEHGNLSRRFALIEDRA